MGSLWPGMGALTTPDRLRASLSAMSTLRSALVVALAAVQVISSVGAAELDQSLREAHHRVQDRAINRVHALPGRRRPWAMGLFHREAS